MPGAEEPEKAPSWVSGADSSPTDVGMSPQMVRSVQASADRWRQVVTDYRFLVDEELEDMPAGLSEENLLRVEHNRTVIYPDFQFDPAGNVHPVIPELKSLAKKYDWSERSLFLWLVTPTGYFDDDAPVNHLDQPEWILAGARSRFE